MDGSDEFVVGLSHPYAGGWFLCRTHCPKLRNVPIRMRVDLGEEYFGGAIPPRPLSKAESHDMAKSVRVMSTQQGCDQLAKRSACW